MALKTCTKSGWYIRVKLTKITGQERTFMASWTCTWANVDNYEVFWRYGIDKNNSSKYIDTTHNVKHIANNATYQDTFSYPENAVWVQVWVRPHEAEDGKIWKYLCPWSPWSKGGQGVWQYVHDYETPKDIPTPKIEVDRYRITVTASTDTIDYDSHTHQVQFYIVNKAGTVVKYATIPINWQSSTATFVWDGSPGEEYKAAARGYNKAANVYGKWSSYSSTVKTAPANIRITGVKALSNTSVRVNLSDPRNAKGETVEINYTTNPQDFLNIDSTGSSQTFSAIYDVGYVDLEGLETGKTWYFRARVTNESGQSGWSTDDASVTLGLKPDPPTTWSNTVTAKIGSKIVLNWTHNSRDGSHMHSSEIELKVGNAPATIITVPGVKDTETNEYKDTGKYEIDTTTYTDGSNIRWRVRTKGILDSYSDWSITREVKVYAPTTLSVNVYKTQTPSEESIIENLDAFPFYVVANAGPESQKAIGFHISIVANQNYQKTDYNGELVWVGAGEEIYSHFFDFDSSLETVEFEDYAVVQNDTLTLKLMPHDVDFESGQSYTVRGTVTMDVGLTAEAYTTFSVSWQDQDLYPMADVNVDLDDFTATIIPYAPVIPNNPDGMTEFDEPGEAPGYDSDLQLVENVLLSVYRINYDKSMTLIMDQITNDRSTAVIDPHPTTDFVRYRVVATEQSTGAIGFADVDPVKIGQPGIVIQWDENWKDSVYTNPMDGQALEGVSGWSGKRLTLPFNVKTSEGNKPDRATVEYVGQENPTSYFGTQLGVTANWSTEIEKTDTDRLDLLRQLDRYQGNVYVRNSRGVGYWAVVEFTYNIDYGETMTIPISISVKKVRGGI